MGLQYGRGRVCSNSFLGTRSQAQGLSRITPCILPSSRTPANRSHRATMKPQVPATQSIFPKPSSSLSSFAMQPFVALTVASIPLLSISLRTKKAPPRLYETKSRDRNIKFAQNTSLVQMVLEVKSSDNWNFHCMSDPTRASHSTFT